MAGLASNPDFDAFTLPEEHRLLRAAVRELAEQLRRQLAEQGIAALVVALP